MRECDKQNVLKTMKNFDWNKVALASALLLQASNMKELESIGRSSIAGFVNKLLVAGYSQMFPSEQAANE